MALPFTTKLIEEVCNEKGILFRDQDEGAGYLFSLETNGLILWGGCGSISSYPINPATAVCLAKDKFFTHKIAACAGIATIPTQLFFTTDLFSASRSPGRELSDLFEYAQGTRFPLFVKPNKGSRGDFAERISDFDQLRDYCKRVSMRHDQIIVQPFLDGAEARVFVLDEQCIYQYFRPPNKLLGNDVCTWREVLLRHNAWLHAQGLSEITESSFELQLGKENLSASEVSSSSIAVPLAGRRNISADNSPENFSTKVHSNLANLAIKITRQIGLRVAGVDFLIPSKDNSGASNSAKVLEVNGNPSIDSLEIIGRTDLAKKIWAYVIDKWIKDQKK
jgi:glutathione synthase/RimK-type ligase-like ATP-grasp enzyme